MRYPIFLLKLIIGAKYVFNFAVTNLTQIMHYNFVMSYKLD